MNNTDPLFLKDSYLKEDVGVIKRVSSEFGISLDRSIFLSSGWWPTWRPRRTIDK
jgi:Ser-tRNA(Ala) deacylase AlaX